MDEFNSLLEQALILAEIDYISKDLLSKPQVTDLDIRLGLVKTHQKHQMILVLSITYGVSCVIFRYDNLFPNCLGTSQHNCALYEMGVAHTASAVAC